MRTRILPHEEWERLEAESLPPTFPYSDDVAVVVVEDDSGRIVGTLTAVTIVHLEGMWIDPEHRGKGGVARALVRQATAVARHRGDRWVLGGMANGDERMERILARLGGVRIPATFWALGIGEGPRLRVAEDQEGEMRCLQQ
jgi:GNAT superfamily N-acetyltransferase